MAIRSIGNILAKHVKQGSIDPEWCFSTCYDLASMDELCAAFPEDAHVTAGETEYLPDGRFIIMGDFAGHDNFTLTTAVFVSKKFGRVSSMGVVVDWERRRLSHPDAIAGELRHIARGTPAILSMLFKQDYVRQVAEAEERRSPIGRSQGLPMYRIERRAIRVDWFSYYKTNPSCRQNLPAGVSNLPLHDVVQHWCERQMSGDPHCPHEWKFHDVRHKECAKCGRYSWFRDTFYRGDEKNGVIVHDRVTGKRFKAAA